MTQEKLTGLQQLNELKLTGAEETEMLRIFTYMEDREAELDRFDLSGTEPMVHVMPMVNVLREDKRVQSFSREELLAGAPEHTEDSWQVPRLVK